MNSQNTSKIIDITGQEEVCSFVKAIGKVMKRMYKKTPSITRSEVVYNTNLLFPCFEAMVTLIENHAFVPYFVPGEDALEAMSKQLKAMGAKADNRRIYKADG
ncbi:hypothetical protein EDC96DRAFT_574255 [Choanephora cucurbitarum]|nr:hypothetical protein EDC96DRAFT_574255 [Choanephora cucurbitarum]